MSETYTSNIDKQLKTLQAQFHMRVFDQSRKIQSLVNQAVDSANPGQALQELCRLAYDIVGSARTFGRADIGDIARDIANLIDQNILEEEPVTETFASELESLCSSLLGKAAEVSIHEPDLRNHLPSGTSWTNRSEPVYLVSNNPTETDQIREIVESIGFEVCEYSDLNSLQEKQHRKNPSIVIIDLDTTDANSIDTDVIKTARQMIEPQTPIIIISSVDNFEARLSAQRAGASRFMRKPIKRHHLESFIRGISRKDTHKYRIMLIDDDEILLGYHRLVLEEAGMEILAINDPMKAWQAATDFAPDVIISDVYMSNCTGPEFASILRETDSFAHTPIIYLSSEREIAVQLSALGLGGDEFFTKPIDSKHFVTAIRIRAQRSRHMRRINSELKQALKERDFQQNALNQHAIVSTADALGDINYVNRKFCEVSGYSEQELIGRNHRLLKSGTHSDEFYQNIWETITQGKTWTGTICNRKKDGSPYWVESTIVPFLDDNSIPTQYISIRTEITPLVESEDRLRRSQAFANIGTWDWNIQTGQLYWSERIASLFGYTKELPETTYENFLAAIHPDDRQMVVDAIGACIEKGEDYDVEHRVIWSDGSIHWLHEKGDVTYDGNGAPLHMLGAVQDITTRHDFQERIKKAQEEAEHANQAKSEFLSSMSHELRTPLNAILGFGQLLQVDQDNPLNEEQKESIDEILHAGNHLLELINEILDLSKIEAGHVNLSLEPVNLHDVMLECESLIQPMTNKHHVTLEFDHASAKNLFLQADRTRLKQVLLNFLSNGLKYNRPNGQVRIFASRADNNAKISVIDTGFGIDKEVQNQLFQPFNRLGAEETTVEGTGIGLVITKRLVESMGGEVGVDSTKNIGSTFWFKLPTVENERLPDSVEEKEDTQPKTESTNTKNCTLLYIEDNPANMRLVEQLIQKKKNYTLVSAPSANIGIELAKTHYPDIILLDINLPGMNGFDAFTELRKNDELNDTPIIALSANATQQDISRGLEHGFNAYLIKPLDIDLFYNTLDKYLQQ